MSPGPATPAQASAVEASAASAAAAMAAAAESLQARLELLLDERLGPLSADQRGFLQVAKNDGQRLLKLIADFGEIALAEAGLLELDCGRVDLAETAREAAEDAAAPASSADKTVTADTEGASVVSGDVRRVRDAVGRLVRHAIRQSAPGATVELDAGADGISLRYEAERAPAADALPVAFATAIARAHGGRLTVGFEAEVVTIEFVLRPADGAVVRIGVAA